MDHSSGKSKVKNKLFNPLGLFFPSGILLDTPLHPLQKAT